MIPNTARPAPIARTSSGSPAPRRATGRRGGSELRPLDRDRLPDHVDRLFRAAWAMSGSRHDAEDLVQETFLNVLKRPRLLRGDNELGYLLRALRNTHASWYRNNARRRADRPLCDLDAAPAVEGDVSSREIMEAIASTPQPYREAVIAVDLIGLSYGEAAKALRTREATVASRLYRGRQHVARVLNAATSDA